MTAIQAPHKGGRIYKKTSKTQDVPTMRTIHIVARKKLSGITVSRERVMTQVRIVGLTAVALTAFALFAGGGSRAQAPNAAPGTQPSSRQATQHDFAKWEKEIAAFEAADRTSPPPKGAVLFTGSSTIRMWKTLAEDYPNHKVINRGFGGSEIVDATHFADRIIFPYAPKQVFLRAGGNDIHAGRLPEEVAADFAEFVRVVHERLPRTEIVYITFNSAPSRWGENDKLIALNKMIREAALHMRHVSVVDAYDISMTPEGKARPELFLPDMLHFNAEGYKLLVERVRPYLPTPP